MINQSTPNLLKEGISLIKSGKKSEGHNLLLEIVGEMSDNETCWLWLAISAATVSEQIGYLQQALVVNPHNEKTQSAIKKLESKRDLKEQAPELSVINCPFCQTSIESETHRCGTCHAYLNFDDIEGLLRNHQVDRKKIELSILSFENQLSEQFDPEIGLNLSLAYLNLNQLDRGLTCLKDVLSSPGSEGALRLHYQDLQNEQLRRSKLSTEPLREKSEKKASVMIVDDSPTIRKLVSTVLKRKNYDVWEAQDGMEALATLNDEIPDLILLDINMPRMDGYQVCKLIRNYESTQDVTIIMLSGNDGFFDKFRGKVAGANLYITKPFDPETLVQVVAENI